MAKVVPESCQRTDGIDAWLEIKSEKETKRMEKEERKRDKKKVLNDFTEERNARNAERQLDFELKQLQKLTSEDSQENQVMIEEKEDQIKNLENILVNKGALSPPCDECNACNNEKEVCQCFCGLCQERRDFLKEHPPKPPSVRGPIRCVKKIRGKRGKPDTIEYLVNIDVAKYDIQADQLSDFKEVFAIFDKDGDGVVSFAETEKAMTTLGQRVPEKALRRMVKEVSEDKENDTLEFNEYLTMLGLQNIRADTVRFLT